MFQLCTEKAPINNSLELLSIYTHIGVKPRKELEQRGNKASSTDEYWIVKRGDIIVNKLLAWMGAIGVSHYDGVTSPAYDILRGIQPLNSDFYHYLFRTGAYLREFKSRSTGIMEMRLRLYFDKFGQIPLVYPPLPDQTAIVQFLDHCERLVNQAIHSKRRLIKVLNEQKQVIIHQAVTRGLNPNVRLKPSGIEWLGDVPEHWDILKISRCFSLIGSGTTPPTGERNYYEGGTIPWVITGDLNNGVLTSPRHAVTDKAVSQLSALKIYPKGTILLAMYGATIGKVAILDIEACVNQACCALGRSNVLAKEYGLALLLAFRTEIVKLGIGGGQPNISQDIIKNVRLPIPPISEQEIILQNLNMKLYDIDSAIDRTHREISLLREYHTRLIADVVTGKLDVREIELPFRDRVVTLEEIDIDEDTEVEEFIEIEEVVNAYE